MGSPSELSLEYRPNGYAAALKPFGDQPDQTQTLEEFLARLEEERLKIEVFKRELPLCMQLLNNAMEAYRHQLDMYHTSQGTSPVLEEFIPLKRHGGVATDGPDGSPAANDVSSETAGWTTTAQLWNIEDGGVAQQPAVPQEDTDNRAFDVTPKVSLDRKQRHGGAFLPFSKERSSRGRGVVPELALAPMENETSEKQFENTEAARRESCGKGGEQGKATPVANVAVDGGQAAAAQTHRKARRCWTPELHRRFVNALHMLGGSQVATPKQIRELMKVDGLTNDEVKSHLQKYRLHTRRPMSAPHAAAASATAPQLVVLGGIWVPPEYATTAAAGGPVIYGAHSAAAHFCAATPVQQDFHSPSLQLPPHYPPPPSQHHRDHATAASGYKMKHGSPESEVRGSRDRSESMEDREEEVEGDVEVEEEEEVGDEKAVQAEEEGKVSNGGDLALGF